MERDAVARPPFAVHDERLEERARVARRSPCDGRDGGQAREEHRRDVVPRPQGLRPQACLDALALLGAITLLGTERIVLGGGLSLAGDALVAPLRERLLARARVAVVPEIVTAGLGPRAGVVGAALATLAF